MSLASENNFIAPSMSPNAFLLFPAFINNKQPSGVSIVFVCLKIRCASAKALDAPLRSLNIALAMPMSFNKLAPSGDSNFRILV